MTDIDPEVAEWLDVWLKANPRLQELADKAALQAWYAKPRNAARVQRQIMAGGTLKPEVAKAFGFKPRGSR